MLIDIHQGTVNVALSFLIHVSTKIAHHTSSGFIRITYYTIFSCLTRGAKFIFIKIITQFTPVTLLYVVQLLRIAILIYSVIITNIVNTLSLIWHQNFIWKTFITPVFVQVFFASTNNSTNCLTFSKVVRIVTVVTSHTYI